MNAPHIPPMPPAVTAQIIQLPDLPMSEIKDIWTRLFGKDVPTRNRRFLERRIAYKLQENEFRKIDPALLDRNKERIQALLDAGNNKSKQESQPVPGTVLTREYHGAIHRVVAMQDGQYDYQGRPYKSLSVIAREITGTRWSGPLFFGLKQPAKRGKKGGK